MPRVVTVLEAMCLLTSLGLASALRFSMLEIPCFTAHSIITNSMAFMKGCPCAYVKCLASATRLYALGWWVSKDDEH
jgi:hypothetical protein